MNCSWEQIRREIRTYRSSVSPSNIANIKDFCFDERNNRAYFLATDPSRMKSSTLFVVDLPPLNTKKEKTELFDKFRDQSESPFSFTNDGFCAKEFSFTFCSSTSYSPLARFESIKPSSLDNFDFSFMNNKSQQSSALPKIPTVEWKPLLPESYLKEKHFSETLSREEMFVKERRRLALQGITSYQFDSRSGQILFNYGSGIYLGHVSKNTEFYPRPIIPYSSNSVSCSGGLINYSLANSPPNNHISPLSSPSSPCCSSLINVLPPRLDPKLGGRNYDLVAFIRDRDIWVTTLNGLETQLTFCNEHDPDGSSALSCGVAEFVMQEEFHRFTGYYWAPSFASTCTKEHVERILYLQISESMVDLVLIPRPGQQGEAEEYRYPKAGTPNAVSDLQIVEFIPRYSENEEATIGPIQKRLWGPAALDKLFPWKEYIVRFGWCPSGKSVWAQLLDRPQRRTAIVKIPIINFMSLSEYQKSGGELDELCMSRVEVVFEETSDIWINVTDICYLFNEDIISLKTTDTNTSSPHATRSSLPPTKLIITSESSGFRHLYLVNKPSSESPHYHIRPITAGSWPVVDRPIYVDTKRELVYFTAKKDTPLETHIYVASYAETADPYSVIRLSELGYSHIVVMDEKCERYLDWFSNIKEKPRCGVRYFEWDEGQIFPKVSETLGILVKGMKGSNEDEEVKNNEDKRQNERIPLGEFFNFKNSDGVTIYGCLYRPINYVPGKKYPTLLSIYGGPKSQMVTNDYKYPRLLRLFLAAHLGFSVVLIDGRGSSDRGLEFESYLKGRMGTVELDDQIAGLKYLSLKNMGVDLERVAITGWSYGGYLSLMALAQYPQIFKLAIAGAPVTQWELYDTAYTERYMGLPEENIEGYHNGNVLTWAEKFPDSENRLLIAHGQIDENVHFKNSELLVSSLVKFNKPHVLQPYPTERHGLRHASVAEHFETLMFFWLVNYL